MQIICPQCGESYEVGSEYEGSEVQCESCGRRFVVSNAENESQKGAKKIPEGSCLVAWLVLFALQGVGSFIGWLINSVVDALVISLMLDQGLILTVAQFLIQLVSMSVASYLAFRFLVVKMISSRLAKEV
ncbi:MAG: hypothetical protein IJS08_19410 [Victivallales bacterium]|nr:hypothetical protein [Victivallales bacterium]